MAKATVMNIPQRNKVAQISVLNFWEFFNNNK